MPGTCQVSFSGDSILDYLEKHMERTRGCLSLGMSWDYVDGFAVNPIYINTVIYTSKFREVLFICPICVYGPILLAGGSICV